MPWGKEGGFGYRGGRGGCAPHLLVHFEDSVHDRDLSVSHLAGGTGRGGGRSGGGGWRVRVSGESNEETEDSSHSLGAVKTNIMSRHERVRILL